MHIAYCGFDCTKCPVYKATETADETLRKELLEQYATVENPLTREDLFCKGCCSESAGHTKLCAECGMRLCARRRGVKICAHCERYPCTIIEKSLPQGGEGRKRLDRYRK